MNAPFIALALLVTAAPRMFEAESADLKLPVPAGWRFNPNQEKPSPSAPVVGKKCVNNIWFDFIPGASVELTRELIDTESIDVTMAIRRWDERTQIETTLAGHTASQLQFSSMPERSVYFLATAGGTLVIQAMVFGDRTEIAACASKQSAAAAKLTELFFAPDVQTRAEELSKTVPAPTPKKLEPVPSTLDEAYAMLERDLPKKDLEELKDSTEKDLSRYHLSLGMGLRNRWGLWGASPLAKHFNALGVFRPDDMSGVIIRTFWRRLNGKPTEVEREVADIVHHHALRTPPEAMACGNKKAARALFQLEGRDPEKVVSIFYCDAQNAYWAWELARGWYQPEAPLKRRAEKLRRTAPGLVSGPLEE